MIEFKQHTLPNGLSIVAELNKAAQSAAVGFFVKTGARDENENINGVSHFLEHMLFKGTEKLSAFDVNKAFDRTGAKFNAFTSEENTVYYAAVLPEYFIEIAGLWAELLRPSLREDDFNIEKNVIKEEIAMYLDLPQFDVMDRCRTLHFGSHPCHHSVLGSSESIDALTAEQMRAYFYQQYSPANITVVCTGNFDWEKLCRTIEDKCGSWEPIKAERQTEFFNGTFEKQRIEKENLVREHICLISPTAAFQDELRYAASLLAIIIGDDTGSRFFWELVDNAKAEQAAMHYEPMDGVGAYYSYIRTGRENLEEVFSIINRIFETIAKDDISEDELQKAKNKVLSLITIKNEVPMGRLVELGFNWLYQKKYIGIAEEIDNIKKVSSEHIKTLIAQHNPAKYTQLTIGPA